MHGCYILIELPLSFLSSQMLLFCCTGLQSAEIDLLQLIDGSSCASASLEECGKCLWNTVGTAFGLRHLHFFDPKSCSNSCVFFKAVVCEMFTAQNRVIPWPLPISTSPLHLLSPLLPQCWVVWKLEQTNAILISVRTTRSYTKLNYSDAFILDLNSYDAAIGHRIVLYAFPS